VIFIDANVPMYLIGAEHPHREDSMRLIRRAVEEEQPLFTSAEVLQEILHRYSAIGRLDAVQPCFDALLSLVDEVLSIDLVDLQRAKEILLGMPRISARDALHVAVMERHRIGRIISFDAGFDAVPHIVRLR
jgi:uncharacterized protein